MGRWIGLVAMGAILATSAWGQARPVDTSAGLPATAGLPARARLPDPPKKAAAAPTFRVRPTKSDTLGEYSPGAFLRNLTGDQKAIWTSPGRLHQADLGWLVPLAGFGATLLATDSETSRHLSNSQNILHRSTQFSDIGVGALGGAVGGMYLWGKFTHNRHEQETGFLAIESLANALVVNNAVNFAAGRERPGVDGSRGRFGVNGRSFPSNHAVAAWAVASVVAHEYPGPLTKLLAYGLAGAVSVSRITAKQHFPSDVFFGSAIGWLIGEEAYRAHHDPEVGGGVWNTFAHHFADESSRSPANMASPYVPLDSWVYPAMERLAALGYLRTDFEGSRPWTRLECARLVDEAEERINDTEKDPPKEAGQLEAALAKEFAGELNLLGGGRNKSLRLESVYSRVTEISGKPLNDSYHFGQTIINDFGRPYARGFNNDTGFSGWATDGPLAVYVRAEYQHAPSLPAYPLSVRQVIAAADDNPLQPATPVAQADQFRLLDTYVAANLENWQVSFGKESLWWGPGAGGPLLFSDNAEPIYMGRISRWTPFKLPWIFGWLGPMKIDAFFGKLSGNQFPPRALIHGELISFKPTPNLELGFSRMAEMGGVGRPITAAAIWNSYVSPRESIFFGANESPGKRTAGFEFSYRVPYLRNWLTLYAESISPDDLSPISAPRRAAVSPGIYLTHFPKLPRLDLRVEAVNTNTPSSPDLSGGHFVYYDSFYHDLSTNKKNIIGSWIGRDGQGFQAWSTYWLSARNTIQLSYRHGKIDPEFIPGGGTLNDFGVRANLWLKRDVSLSTSVQYERWLYPVLAPTLQSNVTTSFQLTFWPRLQVR